MLRFSERVEDRDKVVSALAQIESRSTISRLRKGSRLLPHEAASAVNFATDALGRMIEQPITPAVLNAAAILAERHYLRALDAVQLGCAVVARDLLAAPDMRLIASDKELLEAAAKEGFDIWNPCD